MRVKRGKDSHWKVCKYKGDGAFYARCKCGFYYSCGSIMNHKEYTEWTLYLYCPSCGARKKWYNTEPIKMEKEFPWM